MIRALAKRWRAHRPRDAAHIEGLLGGLGRVTRVRCARVSQEGGDAVPFYVVLGELYYGAVRSAYREKQLEQVRRFLRAVVVIGADAQTSEVYGRLRSELAEAGRPIPENDIWIAALALQYRLPLATRDQHFGRIAGLDVLSW